MLMKNTNDTIGNRNRDLPACSAVPQPTALPRAPRWLVLLPNYGDICSPYRGGAEDLSLPICYVPSNFKELVSRTQHIQSNLPPTAIRQSQTFHKTRTFNFQASIRKESWSNLKYHAEVHMKAMRKTTTIV
jgi:hypothetical protein